MNADKRRCFGFFLEGPPWLSGNGETALSMAKESEREDFIQLILKAGQKNKNSFHNPDKAGQLGNKLFANICFMQGKNNC